MEIAALIAWILTAGGGSFLLLRWLQAGGQRAGASRLPAPLVFGHFGLAVIGLIVWIIYVANDSDGLAWTGLVLVVLIAALGATLVTRWLPARTAAAESGADPDQRLPFPVVAGHGLLAVITFVLVLLSALDVGSS